MTSRFKTAIEKAETPQQEADRLRGALFAISLCGDLKEAEHIAHAAMSGEFHGHEIGKMRPSYVSTA